MRLDLTLFIKGDALAQRAHADEIEEAFMADEIVFLKTHAGEIPVQIVAVKGATE